jgi:hypothetical protein
MDGKLAASPILPWAAQAFAVCFLAGPECPLMAQS